VSPLFRPNSDIYVLEQTSGTSNVADRPITKQYIESEYPFSDKADIFSYLKKRDVDVPYAQRASDVVVTEAGLEFGVKTYILMMPSIYGIGTSPLHEFCHVPILIRAALKLGKVPVVGDGSGIWDHVHINDVAGCYEFVLNQILVGQDVPSGKEGIFFVESGEHSWRELSQRIAEAGVAIGALKATELLLISLDEAAETLGRGWRLIAEIGWASKYVYVVKQPVFITSFS
jgi:nucleoside-diphosphate-sugar epimerase